MRLFQKCIVTCPNALVVCDAQWNAKLSTARSSGMLQSCHWNAHDAGLIKQALRQEATCNASSEGAARLTEQAQNKQLHATSLPLGCVQCNSDFNKLIA